MKSLGISAGPAISSCDSQHDCAVHVKGVCIAKYTRREDCKVSYLGAFERRWPYLLKSRCQVFSLCNILDAPRSNFQSSAEVYETTRSCATLNQLLETLSTGRSPMPPDLKNMTLSRWLPGEKGDIIYFKSFRFPVANACQEVNSNVSTTGISDLEVRCDANSKDQGKEEIEWKNGIVSTPSGALAEWRSARTRTGQDIVDWGRYHLQVMFVDRYHRVRSRLAEGLFERIAAWNGFGLILYGHSCGIDVEEGERPSMGYQGEAHRLGIARHVFKAPATTLDRSDLDGYDLIVAMDIEVRDEILRIACLQSPGGSGYSKKVRLISEFVSYGNTSFLEDDLLEVIQPFLRQALTALEVQETYMSQYSAWRTMVATITLCCAGLVQFLMDEYPDDLPDYDPVD